MQEEKKIEEGVINQREDIAEDGVTQAQEESSMDLDSEIDGQMEEPQVSDESQEEVELDGAEEPQDSIEPKVEQPKMFDQNYVNDIVGKTRMEAREKAMRNLYDRYGVNGDDELDGILGKGQAYDVLQENFNNTNAQLQEALVKMALMESGILPSKWEDAKLILTGKNMEVTLDNINRELATHPEWMSQQSQVNNSAITMGEEDLEEINRQPQPQKVKAPITMERYGAQIPEQNADDEKNIKNDVLKNMFGL